MKAALFLVASIFFLPLAESAHALAGTLDKPGVAHNAGYPLEAKQQVQAALQRPDCKYLGGNFINSHTSLSYQGTTKALSMFLEALAKCPGATVAVSFTREPLPKEGSDWSVSHEADANRFHVRVNLESKQIDVSKLYIPPATGPALPPAATKDEPKIPAK